MVTHSLISYVAGHIARWLDLPEARWASSEASCLQAAAGEKRGMEGCFLGSVGRSRSAMPSEPSEPSPSDPSEDSADSDDTGEKDFNRIIHLISIVTRSGSSVFTSSGAGPDRNHNCSLPLLYHLLSIPRCYLYMLDKGLWRYQGSNNRFSLLRP